MEVWRVAPLQYQLAFIPPFINYCFLTALTFGVSYPLLSILPLYIPFLCQSFNSCSLWDGIGAYLLL